MRHLALPILMMLFSLLVFAQTPNFNAFEIKGKFDFDNPSEKIIVYDFLDNGAKLRLIGERTVQIWDINNNKVLESRKHGIENLSPAHFGGISPDQSKIVVLGFEIKNGKNLPETIVPAKIYNIADGNLFRILDKPGKSVKSVKWSKNGRMLVTADNDLFGSVTNQDETEIGFWDGETVELQSSVNIKNIKWFYLSENGEDFFTASVPEKKGLLAIPFLNIMTNVINIWDTRTAKNDRNLSVGDENFHTNTFKMMPSPDGKYFALVSKNKETDTEHRVLVWKIGGGEMPEYTIKASPKIRESTIKYSPDGKYFALDSGKNTQIYEIETGKKTAELADYNLPDFWVNENRVLLYNHFNTLKAVQISTGATIFEKPIVYVTNTTETFSGTTNVFGDYDKTSETEVVDSTRIVPSPNGEMFLTYSNAALEVFNSQTGQTLQAIVKSPPIVENKKKLFGITIFNFKTYPEKTIQSAKWSENGRRIIILNAKEKSVSIWEMKN